jgi:hypothetical protein
MKEHLAGYPEMDIVLDTRVITRLYEQETGEDKVTRLRTAIISLLEMIDEAVDATVGVAQSRDTMKVIYGKLGFDDDERKSFEAVLQDLSRYSGYRHCLFRLFEPSQIKAHIKRKKIDLKRLKHFKMDDRKIVMATIRAAMKKPGLLITTDFKLQGEFSSTCGYLKSLEMDIRTEHIPESNVSPGRIIEC